ncbi:MAG: N-acetylmuramoyl-L-alanine amidase [Desulfobacterales bacterium]|nr:N-acetylmuramoyl-L-alanine amidase [Desulfobacterales bacterium]
MALFVFVAIFSLLLPDVAKGGIEYEYRRAYSRYEKLLKDPAKQKYRDNWLACIKRFKSVYMAKPDSPRADDSLFMIGRLYSGLYKFSSHSKDRQQAVNYYSLLLTRFPRSQYRFRAKKAISALRIAGKKAAAKKTNTSRAIPLKKGVAKSNSLKKPQNGSLKRGNPKPGAGSRVEVNGLRFWSNPNYTRVVIDVEQEAPYTYHLLKKDPAKGKPQRLYIDVANVYMGANLKPVVPIGDELLSNARAAQYTSDTVRVVVDIKSIDKFNVFSLKNPFRIVLDVNGTGKKTSPKKKFRHELEKPGGKVPEGALTKQLALGVRRIVIDPGHGGKDPGALGYYKNVVEKNVTLEIARRLAGKIRKQLGCEAVLTRKRDAFLSLEERTAIANTKNADIFISIHTNASEDRDCHGIETYFLNLATDNDAIMVAARENATSARNISDLEVILNDLLINAKVNESSRLAGHVQQSLMQKLKPTYNRLRDNGVKQAPFYVLLGAEMPCILVETAFITNKKECRRLNTRRYQDQVADAIVKGLRNYIKEIGPAVLTRANRIRARR